MKYQVKDRYFIQCRLSTDDLITLFIKRNDKGHPDYSALVECMKDFILQLAQDLKTPHHYNRIIMAKILQYRNPYPFEALDLWLESNRDCIVNDIEFAWYRTLVRSARRIKKLYKTTNPKNVEAVLMFIFRKYLGKEIDNFLKFYKYKPILTEESFEPIYPDWFLLKNLQLNLYELYLLKKFNEGYSKVEIAKILHTVDMSILRTLRTICQKHYLIEKKNLIQPLTQELC